MCGCVAIYAACAWHSTKWHAGSMYSSGGRHGDGWPAMAAWVVEREGGTVGARELSKLGPPSSKRAHAAEAGKVGCPYHES